MLCVLFGCVSLYGAQLRMSAQVGQSGMPSSGGYTPSPLSLVRLMESDAVLQNGLMSYVRSGDKRIFREQIMAAAERGDVGAELLLAEQYIPQQCFLEMDQDVPHCGKDGKQAPLIVFQSPLGIDASYEEAVR